MTTNRTPQTTHWSGLESSERFIVKRKCRPKPGGTSFLIGRLFEAGRSRACFALLDEPRVVFGRTHHEEIPAHERVGIAAKLRAIDHVMAFLRRDKPNRNAQARDRIL